jgi:hypothetical protein
MNVHSLPDTCQAAVSPSRRGVEFAHLRSGPAASGCDGFEPD